MYDAICGELTLFKQKYNKMAADYKTLEEQVKVAQQHQQAAQQQQQTHPVETVPTPSATPTLASLQLQLNERNQDALWAAESISQLEEGWSNFDQRLGQVEQIQHLHSIDLEEQKQYS